MLYREIIAVCSEIHTKHTNSLCGQKVELLNVKLVVHIVATGLLGCNWKLMSQYTIHALMPVACWFGNCSATFCVLLSDIAAVRAHTIQLLCCFVLRLLTDCRPNIWASSHRPLIHPPHHAVQKVKLTKTVVHVWLVRCCAAGGLQASCHSVFRSHLVMLLSFVQIWLYRFGAG